jgi:hypothetical protein
LVREGYPDTFCLNNFTDLQNSGFTKRRSFGVATDIGDGEVLVVQFFTVVDIPINLKEWTKKTVQHSRVREDREFTTVKVFLDLSSSIKRYCHLL